VSAVTVVTGAGSGIGRALALARAAAPGARLALCDRDGARADDTAAACRAAGAEAFGHAVDVADADAVHAFAAEVERAFGAAHLVVNNAGVSWTGAFEGSEREAFDWVMDVNFWGVVHGSRAFLPLLRRSAPAGLVQISSIFGLIGMPTQTAYCASKAAVRAFGESLRAELHGSGVRVHLVHPGAVATRIAEDARYTDAGPLAPVVDPKRARRLIARGMPPERAAARILRGVARGEDRILVGRDAVLLDLLQRAFPVGYAHLLRWGQRWV